MARQCAMARFAADPRVLAFGLDVGLLGVAGFAHLASGELDRPGANVVHGAWPEMPIFAKLGRNHGVADDEERDDPQDQQDCDTE